MFIGYSLKKASLMYSSCLRLELGYCQGRNLNDDVTRQSGKGELDVFILFNIGARTLLRMECKC